MTNQPSLIKNNISSDFLKKCALSETSVSIGQLAESNAQAFLEKQGLTLLEKNYRIKGGEIDLIMQDADYLVFIEVKMRRNTDYGNTLELISRPKQNRIIRAATCYLASNQLYDCALSRFDAIGISPNSNNNPEITWIKNAFEVQY